MFGSRARRGRGGGDPRSAETLPYARLGSADRNTELRGDVDPGCDGTRSSLTLLPRPSRGAMRSSDIARGSSLADDSTFRSRLIHRTILLVTTRFFISYHLHDPAAAHPSRETLVSVRCLGRALGSAIHCAYGRRGRPSLVMQTPRALMCHTRTTPSPNTSNTTLTESHAPFCT